MLNRFSLTQHRTADGGKTIWLSIFLLLSLTILQNGCAGLASSSGGGPGPQTLTVSNASTSGVTTTSATVSWQTNLPASSQIEYGTSASYGSTTALDATLVMNHQQSMSGLNAGTLYHFRVHSRDTNNNGAVSADMTVTTATAPDTTAPTVSISSPASASTVSGTVTVSAAASDNVGVAGVQFRVDGNNFGAEDTSSPYSASLNTTTLSNGSHSLTAVARDAAGNRTTSSAVTVSVNNAPVADSTPPSVPTNLNASAASSSQVNLTWSASTDNVGVSGYRIFRGGLQVATSPTTSYLDGGLTPSTTYSYTVAAHDAAGNASAQSSSVSATTQASSGGGIPSTLGWFQVPNTQIANVCAATNGFSQIAGAEGCSGIFAWSGGTADTTRNRLLVWGGGHNAYYGNEVYALDLNTLTMTRLNNPTLPGASSCVDTLSDGKPNSRHTYAGLAYVPGLDQMIATGGSLSCSNGNEGNDLWTLSLSNLQWSKVCGSGNSCGYDNGLNGKISAYDSNTGDVFIDDRAFLYRYNPNTRALIRVTSAGNSLHTNTEIDPVRKRMYVVGDAAIYYINIDPSASGYGSKTNVSTGACSSPANAGYPGMAYDPVRDKIVMWSGGSTIYEINVAATPPTCTANSSFTGGPGSQRSDGTHGRFRYFQALGVFALVNNYNQNAWTLRLSPVSGGGTGAPAISGVNASGLTTNSVTISWTTDVPSTTQVEYGTTTSYGSSTTLNSSLVTSHSQTVSGLAAGTLYHYRTRSKSSTGVESVSGDFAFTTSSSTDTTSPSVSITAPAAGATLSGTVSVSANASDNVGVTSVQFTLDGANLGSPLTSSPYQTTWSTTAAANGVHLLAAVARDAAGNSATSIAVTVTVSNTSSSAERSLAIRCADPAVTLCYGLDKPSEVDPYLSAGNQSTGVIDPSTPTPNTNGSLRFTVTASGDANSAGYWTRNMGRDFGEGQTAYISFRWRADSTFVNTNYAAAGWKMHIFWHGIGGSCTDLQFVTINSFYRGYPDMYRSCGTPGLVAMLPDGDTVFQFGSDNPPGPGTDGYFCTYRHDDPGERNCSFYRPADWMTFYYKFTIGTWNQADSMVEAWVAYEGEPMKKWISLRGVTIPNDNPSSKKLRQIDLLPYDTGRSATVASDAQVWYSEVIVSANPIPPPTGPTP